MSEEEKGAIEFIQKRQDFMKSEPKCVGDLENNIDIILNLIEKQQKEIEELQNEVMEQDLMITGLKENRRIAVEEIQEQYYISKDKIKEKIEFYKRYGKIKNSDEYVMSVEIEVLEELLGE